MNAFDRCKHLPDYPILAVNCFQCTRDYLVELESRLSAAETDAQYQRELANRADHRRVLAEAERDAAVKVAVWAVRKCVGNNVGNTAIIVGDDYELIVRHDGTDADLYRALRDAKESSNAD